MTRDEDRKHHARARCCAHLCRVVRVVIVRVNLVGVRCVTVVHIGHDEVLVVVLEYVSHFCLDFLYLEMYSLHPPSVTVNCVDCYRYNHCKLCTKLFVRFGPQINRRFTDYHRFLRSISVESIFVVRSHNRDATRMFAIATMRRNCATNCHSAHCPPFS